MADCDRCLEGREKGLESDGIADSHAQNTAPTKPGASHKRSYLGDAITPNRTEEDMGLVRFPLHLPASKMTAGTKRTYRVVCYLSAFGGKPEKHTLVLSLTAFEPSGHSEAFTRLAYRP